MSEATSAQSQKLPEAKLLARIFGGDVEQRRSPQRNPGHSDLQHPGSTAAVHAASAQRMLPVNPRLQAMHPGARPTGQNVQNPPLGTVQSLRSNFANKKKEVGLLPPPEYFKKKRAPLKNINLAQWKAQSVLKWLPPRERVEEPRFEELDDFTSLLTRKLYEQLEETEAAGTYTVKDGQYSLIVHTDREKRKLEDSLSAGVDKKNRNLEEMLPGPCFGVLSRLEERRSTFNREEVLQFELLYKDILYDTYIRIGRYYQAYIPEVKPTKAFVKTKVVYGLPPKSQLPIQPPKVYVEFKQKGRNVVGKAGEPTLIPSNNHMTTVPAVPHKEFLVPPQSIPNFQQKQDRMNEEELPQSGALARGLSEEDVDQSPQAEQHLETVPSSSMLEERLPTLGATGGLAGSAAMAEEQPTAVELPGPYGRGSSYKLHDEFEGSLTVECIYTPKRVLQDFLEWDPALIHDSEIVDMIGQVLEEFANDPRVTREILYDYLKLCRLNKERFLDHLEVDHDDFRKYLFMITHKAV